MHPIIYDVAVSIDGYISGPNADISQFPSTGQVVDDYFARLETYSVAIMGRATYEFGYGFGLTPGQNPYPHMQTYVFSKTLVCPDANDITIIRVSSLDVIKRLKKTMSGPIYLCGGGDFAGYLMSEGLVDFLRLKRAPIILGGGVSLFGRHDVSSKIKHTRTELYGAGYLFQEFEIIHARTQ